jgi:tight adherence protein C
MTRETLIVAVAALGLALFFGGAALDAAIARRRRQEARFARYCLRLRTDAKVESLRELVSRNIGGIVGPMFSGFSRALFARERDRAEMRKLLWSAGHRGEHAIAAMAFAKLGGALTGAGVGWALTARTGGFDAMAILLMAGFGVAGAIAPEMVVRARRDARRQRLKSALPDAIDLMVIAAYAGQSLDMALDRVSREMRAFAPDIAEELAVVTAELQALPDRSEALRNFGERADLREARAFALTLIQTIRYGSPFTESLKALGGDLRQAKMIAAEERGAKLPAMLTIPLIVCIMPAVFVVVVGPAVIAVSNMMASAP